MLFYIPFGTYKIYFAIDIFNLVLLNYSNGDEFANNPSLYDISMVGPNRMYSEEINYLGETFYATNTNKSFLNFGENLGESKWEVSNSLNSLLWNDFRKYINNQNCIGTHDILQIGDILINCNFTNGGK
jgi:hypothetical protein